MPAVRKGDVVMNLIQHNAEHDIIIDNIDESQGNIKEILGYDTNDLTGHSIKQFLPTRINENIDDFVEYENFGNDLVNVLKRTRNFAMKSENGKEIELNMRVQNGVSLDENLRYMMVIGSKSLGNDTCIKAIQEVMLMLPKHKATGLIDVSGFNNTLDIVHEHVVLGNMICSVAVVRIDGFKQMIGELSSEKIEELLEMVSLKFKHVFRAADIVSYIQNGNFGVGLMKTSLDNAHIPLERLKNIFENEPIHPMADGEQLTISAAYHELSTIDQPSAIALRVQDTLDGISNATGTVIKC